MLADFNTLPENARFWIYQADRPFNKNEKEIIYSSLSAFLQQWTAHGATLQAGFSMPYDQFIIIGLDESQSGASGCSIDGLFRLLQQLGVETGLDFFNRELIAFYTDDRVVLVKRNGVKDFLASRGGNVLTFNNLITSCGALKNNWLVPAHTTWLKRYIAPISV